MGRTLYLYTFCVLLIFALVNVQAMKNKRMPEHLKRLAVEERLKGDGYAALALAEWYFNNHEYDVAYKYLRKAWDKGLQNHAGEVLGILYYQGKGRSRNVSWAKQIWHRVGATKRLEPLMRLEAAYETPEALSRATSAALAYQKLHQRSWMDNDKNKRPDPLREKVSSASLLPDVLSQLVEKWKLGSWKNLIALNPMTGREFAYGANSPEGPSPIHYATDQRSFGERSLRTLAETVVLFPATELFADFGMVGGIDITDTELISLESVYKYIADSREPLPDDCRYQHAFEGDGSETVLLPGSRFHRYTAVCEGGQEFSPLRLSHFTSNKDWFPTYLKIDAEIMLGVLGKREGEGCIHFMEMYKNFRHHFTDPIFIHRVDAVTALALKLALNETEDRSRLVRRVFVFGILKAYTARMPSCARWNFELVLRWLMVQKGLRQPRWAAGVCLDAEILTVLKKGEANESKAVTDFVENLSLEYENPTGRYFLPSLPLDTKEGHKNPSEDL